jgi:hypothetical protein
VSYTISIVHVPVPDDDAAAWKLCEQLYEESDPEEPLPEDVKQLYQTLVARYPCITTDEGEDSPWSDGPLLDNFARTITTLGFISSGGQEPIDFVISTATSMGFTVFDGTSGQLHRSTRVR